MGETIHVFVRHCHLSKNSINNIRPPWFTRKNCLENLLQTSDANTKITVFFDGKKEGHLVTKYPVDIVEAKIGGSEPHSFRDLLQHIISLPLDNNSIIYLLEDDYIHVPGWCNVMREAFVKNLADYVTLYDHNDKYFFPMYKNLESKIFVTESCHWRTVPSTTNTYAMRLGVLKKHIDTHMKYSDLKARVSHDHQKFLHLNSIGARLISSIPGYSTHCEPKYLSPVVKWDEIARDSNYPTSTSALPSSQAPHRP
jgi:hypothetical protein